MTPLSLDLLDQLISFPTISDRPLTEMAALLAQRAEDYGFRTRLFETSPGKVNVISHRGPIDVNGLAFCGHMDVVPTEGQEWHSDPFKATRKGDLIIGRGVCDMKGFIAAALSVAGEVKFKEDESLTLIWTHDEEIGCLGAEALKGQLKAANISLPRSILIGEPTDMNICRMHGGHMTIDVEIRGESAHSSKPWLGQNAILCASALISETRAIQKIIATKPCPHHEMSGAHGLINVAEIKGGQAVNIVPESCHFRLGVRPMPGEDPDWIFGEIKDRFAQIAKRQHCDIKVSRPQNAPPMITADNCALNQALQQVLPSAKKIGVPFATDGGRLAEMGTEPIICGPGSIDVAHKPNESIAIQSLLKCEETLRMLIDNWRL